MLVNQIDQSRNTIYYFFGAAGAAREAWACVRKQYSAPLWRMALWYVRALKEGGYIEGGWLILTLHRV